MRALARFFDDPVTWYVQLRERYGDLVAIDGGLVAMIVCFDLPLLERMLVRDAESFVKGHGLRAARIVVGDGLLTADGELHRRHRRLAAPAFTPRHVETFAEDMSAITRDVLERWPRDGVIAAARHCYDISLRIAGVTLYGSDFDEAELARLHAATRDLDAGYRTLMQPGGNRVIRHGLTPTARRVLRARDVVDEMVNALIAQRRRAEDVAQWRDVLSLLLAARDEDDGDGMSDVQLRDEAVTMLLAGHDTTAASLAWCLGMLASHPEEQRLVRAEVDAVLGTDRACGAAELRELPRVRAFVKETLRLHPAVYSTVRRPIKPLQLDGGQVLPTDVDVVVPISAIHRDPALWDDPLTFRSDRFLDPDVERSRPRLAWMPFGAGPRICIGSSFALQELGIALATIVQGWELAPTEATSLEPQVGFFRRPAGDLPVRVRCRRASGGSRTIAPA